MGLPAPFKRPSVDLDSGGPKRDWATIPASKLAVDDIVSGYGRIKSVEVTEASTTLHNVMDVRFVLPTGKDDVFAFTANG